MLTKSARYFYDAEAVREQSVGEEPVSRMKIHDGLKQAKLQSLSATTLGTPANATRNLRNFWLLGPEPYSEAHFATYPTEISRRAILAGTSARGCCPKCLSPWERVVEKGELVPPAVVHGTPKQCTGNGQTTQGNTGTKCCFSRETRTTGWRATCECCQCDMEPCDAKTSYDPIPCTVLDPFGGSGTTAAVAIELGRRAILCELNPNYIPLIEQRTLVTAGLPLA